jgi:RNA polymerase sigma factor (sigma-70 family)
MLHSNGSWPNPEDLARLVAAAQDARQRGRSRAVDALLATLRPALVSFFRFHGPPDAAEDLAQVALFRVSTALPWIEAERADPFISTVARNLLRTAYRRRDREQRRAAPDGPTALAETPSGVTAADVHAEYEDLARAVHRVATAEMPDALRAVILGLLRGETTSEIAERLHISPVTVRTRLMRARGILRRELRAFLDVGAPGDQHQAG